MKENKCGKYEELFVQEDESALLEHIKACPECRLEYENMQKVSKLIKETAFNYRRQKKLKTKVVSTIAASFFAAFLAFFVIQAFTPNSFVSETIAYISSGEDYTYEEMGLPVDEYGFIMADLGYEF